MLRIMSVAVFVALVAAGCGKKPPPNKTAPITGGHGQVGSGTQPANPGATKPPSTDDPKGPGEPVDAGNGGWIPVAVPDDQKNQDYLTVFHVVKIKGAVQVINLDRYMIARSDHGSATGSSLTAANLIEPKVSWELIGGGIMEKMKDAPDKTDLYFRVHGKRTMAKKFLSPPGTSGEKHDWVVTIDKVFWEKNEVAYTHEVTILEEELWDNYLAMIEGSLDLASSLKMWRGYSATADELGLTLGDRDRDRTKPPFYKVVTALERISESQAVIDKKEGGVGEATAWLKVLLEWSHFPGSVVSGDVENNARELRAREALTGRQRLLENQLRDRLKTDGLKIPPADAGKLLAATDGTMAQKFSIFAAEAGKFQLSAETAMSIFEGKEKTDWKETTLSLFKSAATANAAFFSDWSEADLAAFPARFVAAVYPFTKGKLIPTRNAVAILDCIKKAKPGLAISPSIDDQIAELKKK